MVKLKQKNCMTKSEKKTKELIVSLLQNELYYPYGQKLIKR